MTQEKQEAIVVSAADGGSPESFGGNRWTAGNDTKGPSVWAEESATKGGREI